MQNRVIAIGVLVLGASALGAGVILLNSDHDRVDPQDAQALDQSAPQQMVASAQGSGIDIPEALPESVEVPENVRGNGRRGDRGDGFSRIEDRIKEFDLDGDGILSADERRAMREKMRADFMARMDLDGDGKLSLEERVIAQRERMLGSDRGQRRAMQFDADGDGILSEAEVAALDASIAEREQERIDRDLERYDADGDGVLSEAEQNTQRQEREQQQEQRIQQFTQGFDEDGDGELNEDERVNAFATMRDQRDLDQFLSRYDTDKDREIDADEYQQFLNAYASKENFADVTRDGTVDAEDVMAFRDYNARVNSNP